jgi:hypothetical protein
VTRRTDTLAIRFEAQADGTVKAAMSGVSKEALAVAASVDKMNRELGEIFDRADPAGAALRKLTTDQIALTRAVKEGLLTQAQADAVLGGINRQARTAASGFGSLRTAIGAIGLSTVISQSIQTIAEFERLGAVLKTVEGSQDGANRKFKELQQIASQTPAQLQEVVTAYTTLKSRGLDASRDALLAYANVAAATGKTLQQFVEAVGDAATGEMERLKEFGVVARQQGDQVALTFRGITTVIKKDSGEIEEYLQRIGRVDFAGASGEQMKTLGGLASNLSGELALLAVSIGDSGLTGELKDLVSELTRATRGLNDFFEASNKREGAAGFVGTVIAAGGAFSLPGLLNAKPLDFMEDESRRRARATEEEVSALDLLGEKYTQVAGIVGQIYAAGQAKATEQKKKANEESTKLIAKLREEAATLGLSRSKVLEYEKAQALATATTDEQRKTIGELYDTLIAKTRAEEASTKATKDRTKADAEAKRDAEELRRATERQVAAGVELVESYDAWLRISLDAAAAQVNVKAALDAGAISAEQFDDAIESINIDKWIAYAQEMQKEWKALPSQLPFEDLEWREVGMRAGGGFLDGMTEVMLGGDLGDIGKQFAEQLFGDTFRTQMEQLIGRPLQDMFASGGSLGSLFDQVFGGRSFESAPGFMWPPTSMAGGNVAWGAGAGGGGLRGQNGGMNWGNAMQVAGGVYGVYQAGQMQSRGGAALSGAMSGASAGTAVMPGIGTAIGAIVGALYGYFSAKGNEPRLRVGPGMVDGSAIGPFGRVSVNRDGSMQPGAAGAAAQGIVAFDRQMANLLRTAGRGSELLDRANAALAGWNTTVDGSDANLNEILSRRLDVIISAVEPGWKRLLGNIEDLQTKVESLTALFDIKEQIEGLGETMLEFAGSPLEQTQAMLDALARKATDTAAQLASAIESQDPIAIRDAATAAQEAVVERYRTEIALARDLEAALLDAQAAARATQLGLAQRIQATGGRTGLVSGLAAVDMAALRGQVTGATDPTRALAFLDQFIGSVDTWLQASIADVQQLAQAEAQRVQVALQGIAAQRDAINAALQALVAERDAIFAAAQARTEQENQAAQAQAQNIAAQMQAIRQAEIAGLQEQLGLAEQFRQVVEDARRFLEDLTFSGSNPLGRFARLDLLDNAIGAAEGRLNGSSGADQAAAASELLALLQQRMGLVQQEGLFQRPSNEYLAIYNDTLKRIAEVQGIAKPEADEALDLQRRIAELSNATAESVGTIANAGIRFTDAEQARLDAIALAEAERQIELTALAKTEAALQEELLKIQQSAEAQIAELNAAARAQYEWARGEAVRLEDERQAQILEQLNALTGGRPVDEFIAERSAEAAALLTDIRDDLRAFLDAISTGSVGNGGSVPGIGGPGFGGGGGGGGGPPGDIGGLLPESTPVTLAPVIQITVTGGGNPTDIARAFAQAMDAQLPQLATQLKRELRNA